MSHTRAISITTPADTELVSVGAQRLREIKENIEERMGLDHFWANETDTSLYDADGRHKKLTMEKSTESYVEEDECLVFTEEDSDNDVNLMYRDNNDNEFNLTRGNEIAHFEHRQNVAAFYGYSTTPPQGAYSKQTLITEVDYGSHYSDGVFTAPATGKYRIIAAVCGDLSKHRLKKNDEVWMYLDGTTLDVYSNVTDIIVDLDEDDEIYLESQDLLYPSHVAATSTHLIIINLTE